MKPEIKKKWVDALRSGEYKQGKGSLRNDADEYCCLGVLLDANNMRATRHESYPSSNQRVRLGLEIPGRGKLQVTKMLAQMNDEEGKSFAEIADYIDANL